MNFFIDLFTWLVTNPLLSVVALAAQFIIVMRLHQKYHNKYLHAILGAWFIPQDMVVNVIAFTIIGLEFPKEFLVTARMKRWKKLNPNDSDLNVYRTHVANGICNLLNKYDMGHC